jgi:hypothetical protein
VRHFDDKGIVVRGQCVTRAGDGAHGYWRDPLVFTADCIETSERHIIDDMIF